MGSSSANDSQLVDRGDQRRCLQLFIFRWNGEIGTACYDRCTHISHDLPVHPTPKRCELSEEGNSRHSPDAYSAPFSAFLKLRSLSRSTHSCGIYHSLISSPSPFTGLYKCTNSCTTTANCESLKADPSSSNFRRPNRPTTSGQSSRRCKALSDQKFGQRATAWCISHTDATRGSICGVKQPCLYTCCIRGGILSGPQHWR